MKCCCPWCGNDAVPDSESLFAGEPTCADHDYRAIASTLNKQTLLEATSSDPGAPGTGQREG